MLEVLAGAYDNYAARLRFRPDDPITVVLELGTGFQDPRAPEWAAGLNDGTIHVPLRGMERLSVALVAVLRHELAHSFIRARTGGNCPTWLQEGISQWLEGGDPRREDGVVAAALRQGRLLPLMSLEGPFQSLPPEQVSLAYAESLSAVAHIVRTRGEAAVVRLLAGLGDRLPAEEALPVALALSYPEFQRSWEDALRPHAAAPLRRPVPLERPPQPRLEVDLGPVTEQPMSGGDVGQAVPDVARPRRPELDARGDADLAGQRVEELAQAHAMAGGHVDLCPRGRGP